MNTPAAFQPLTSQSIQRALSTRAFGRTLHVLSDTPSTNTTASALAHQGAPHGTVVVAESQSEGRGRLGRHWHSPGGRNLHCSVVLRARPPRELQALWLSWVPLIAALAAVRAVQAVSTLKPTVKWPNDVLAGNRKLGGILCESSGIGTDHAVVIAGIGLNVNLREEELPGDLRPIATSLMIETRQPHDRAGLLAVLLLEMETRCESFLGGCHDDIRKEYVLRCSTVGRRVRVELAHGERLDGMADSVGPDGALRILRDDRSSVDIHAGDVMHLHPGEANGAS